MRKDRYEAVQLRQEGKSYREISLRIGVPKSTLSTWFRNDKWSQEIAVGNAAFERTKERWRFMHKVRRQRLDAYYARAKHEAHEELQRHSSDKLFLSGLMLYFGEGDKSTNNGQVRISNADFRIILIFKRFLEKFYPKESKKMRISILLYPDLDQERCLSWWSRMAMIERDRFYKPVLIKGRHKSRRLQYGVGSLIICNTFLKVKILKLLDLSSQALTMRA